MKTLHCERRRWRRWPPRRHRVELRPGWELQTPIPTERTDPVVMLCLSRLRSNAVNHRDLAELHLNHDHVREPIDLRTRQRAGFASTNSVRSRTRSPDPAIQRKQRDRYRPHYRTVVQSGGLSFGVIGVSLRSNPRGNKGTKDARAD